MMGTERASRLLCDTEDDGTVMMVFSVGDRVATRSLKSSIAGSTQRVKSE